MKKVDAQTRVAVTVKIEGLFSENCRKCPESGDAKVSISEACLTCPVYKELRGFGAMLGSEGHVPEPYPEQEMLLLAKRNGIKADTFKARVQKGMLPLDAATLPVRGRKAQ